MNQTNFIKKFTKTQFSASSPPEIFVGRKNYPNVFTGILAPPNNQETNTEQLSSPEVWFRKKATISEITDFRMQLVYSRFKTNIKSLNQNQKLNSALSQIAMANSSVRAEFFLKKPPKFAPLKENHIPFIGNPAELTNINLEENPKIYQKVDYAVNDTCLKSISAIKELYKNKIEISSIIKILSAGLLGLKDNRKLVPTRWAITAVDDTLSKEMLKKIKNFPEINGILLFHGEYLGNHYEVLLLPDKFSFEVIETKIPAQNTTLNLIENITNINNLKKLSSNLEFWQDYEGFNHRTTYAASVTGAYYVNRLALCEYLLKINHQASCIFFREVLPEYDIPLGVGILRELSRDIFTKTPEKFSTISEALSEAQSRMHIPISVFKDKSQLLKEYKKQRRLNQWF